MTARLALSLALAAMLAFGTGAARAQNLRIGLREDPDALDPTLARTFVGRIVFASLCDKLFDIDEKLGIVPQLATGFHWDDPKTLVITLREGVKFHDGCTWNSDVAVWNIQRLTDDKVPQFNPLHFARQRARSNTIVSSRFMRGSLPPNAFGSFATASSA